MPLTKVTPRKPGFLCSICLCRLPTHEKWQEHLLACAADDIERRKFECSDCDKAFARQALLIRHQRRIHQVTTKCDSKQATLQDEQDEATTCSVDEGNDKEWQDDPGDLIYENELEAGRTIRKKTSPTLPGVRRRAEEVEATDTVTSEKIPRVVDDENKQVSLQHCPCCKHQVIMLDASTQTQRISHQKTVRIIRKYQKDGECVEKFEEDIWND